MSQHQHKISLQKPVGEWEGLNIGMAIKRPDAAKTLRMAVEDIVELYQHLEKANKTLAAIGGRPPAGQKNG